MTKRFERTFVRATIQPESGEAFQIPGDWLRWGDYIDLQIGVGTGGGGTTWSSWFQLVSLDADISNRNLDFNNVRTRPVEGASSNFTLDSAMSEPRIRVEGVPVPFILHRGCDDALAAVEIRDYAAKDLDEAVVLGRAYFNYLNATFVYLFHVALRYRLLHVVRMGNAEEYAIRTYLPWPEGLPLGAYGFETPAGVSSRLLLMYAEGVMSNSQAYRFLCFFKIVDHVIRVGGPGLRKYREQQFVSAAWLDFNDVLPKDPIARFDVEAVDKTYRETYDRYFKSDIRNSVAHVLATDDSFEPLDPEEAAHFRAAATLFRFISHHLIKLVALNAKSLFAGGAAATERKRVLSKDQAKALTCSVHSTTLATFSWRFESLRSLGGAAV